jgi:hypothetical protein
MRAGDRFWLLGAHLRFRSIVAVVRCISQRVMMAAVAFL